MKYAFYMVLFIINIISIILIYVKISYNPNIEMNLTNADQESYSISCSTINSNVFLQNKLSPLNISVLNSNKSRDLPPSYNDKNYLSDCSLSLRREEIYRLLRWWIDFAAKNDIVWWLRDGTLIGALRHGDIVPWDEDMDIAILSQSESLIRNVSTPHTSIKQEKQYVQILTRVNEHCVWSNSPRYNCQGKLVHNQEDGCSFCGPLARVTRDLNVRIDLYMSRFEFSQGILKVFDESHFEYTNERPLYPVNWVFPLRICQIMNLTVLCPYKAEEYLDHYYQGFSPRYKCQNKTWVKI